MIVVAVGGRCSRFPITTTAAPASAAIATSQILFATGRAGNLIRWSRPADQWTVRCADNQACAATTRVSMPVVNVGWITGANSGL
jgi:hypothetical protein